ncbi:methylaspartate mutase [Micromonospora orduensis]|uniref:methylaspartate mutase n=1 Tax=Micromonospora orduensis TaxID=1420891 RepID=UPI00382AF668
MNHQRPAEGAAGRQPACGSFGQFVADQHQAGRLVVQPRMGMGDPAVMRAGLEATKAARATTAGTITVDSFTRTGDRNAVQTALAAGLELNGYPIADHDLLVSRRVLHGVRDKTFPVQVRHGSARPQHIFAALMAVGLDATEGGPVSYCMPYSRLPLRESVRNWAQACEMFTQNGSAQADPHLETFGGCLLGQLCPPSLLVALSLLEAMFFRQHGVRSVSVSYAQQSNAEQDREAILALRHLARLLLDDCDWHVVLYTYMGLFPRTPEGANGVLAEAARLAVRTGSARLIVKTTAEAHRIPSIAENVAAMEYAASVAAAERAAAPNTAPVTDTGLLDEARALIEATLSLHSDVGVALVEAFRRGWLDIPFCLHPDNAGQTRAYIDSSGWLRWSALGALPIPPVDGPRTGGAIGSADLLDSLSFVSRKFDSAALGGRRGRRTMSHRPLMSQPDDNR